MWDDRIERFEKELETFELIDPQPGLLPKLLADTPETQTWQSKDTVRQVVLEPYTKEYQLVESYFNKKSCNVPSRFTPWKNFTLSVMAIERIENPYLMAGFVLKRKELKSMVPKMNVLTRTMFHATSRAVTDQIIAKNFDWRFAGQKKGEKWGHGISLSPFSDFAAQFTAKETNGDCTMLMCLMLQGNTHSGSVGLEVPKKEFDTTKSPDSKVYVKYHDNTVYPAYRITYCKTKVKPVIQKKTC